MPNSNQGGGYTLTFSEKNKDVREILAEKKRQKIVITDYICEAVRFYEKNKNKNLADEIKEQVNSQIANILGNIGNISNVIAHTSNFQNDNINSNPKWKLEDDLEDVNIDDD